MGVARFLCVVVVKFSSGSDDEMDDDDSDERQGANYNYNYNNNNNDASGRQRRHREKRVSIDDSVSKKAGKCTPSTHCCHMTRPRPLLGLIGGNWRGQAGYRFCSIYTVRQKGATLTVAITLSILHRFAKFFQCCKSIKFPTKLILGYLPHLKHVAALPWKI